MNNRTHPQTATASGIYLPEPIVTAIANVPDVAGLLGEARCLTSPVLHAINYRLKTNQFSGADLATQALLAVISRMADDHPAAVAEPITPRPCGCRDGTGVSAALITILEATPTQPKPPGTGAYL